MHDAYINYLLLICVEPSYLFNFSWDPSILNIWPPLNCISNSQKNLAAGKSNGSLNFKHTKWLILWNWTNLLNTKILVHHMHRQVVLKVRELHQIFDSTQAWGGYMDGFKYIINLLMNVLWSSWNCFPIWISSYNFSLGFINESLPKTTQWAAFTLYQQGPSAWTSMIFSIKVRFFCFNSSSKSFLSCCNLELGLISYKLPENCCLWPWFIVLFDGFKDRCVHWSWVILTFPACQKFIL